MATNEFGKYYSTIALGILIFAVVIVGISSWYIVGKGNNGCVFSNTKGWDYNEKGQGWHFKMPIVESVDKMSFRTQTFQLHSSGKGEMGVLTPKDINGISFNADINVRYRMNSNQICEFIEQKGKDPEPMLLTALRADSTRGVFGQYAQEDVPEKRIEIAEKIKNVLQARLDSESSGQLSPGFIQIEAIDVRKVKFDPKIESAIIEKQTRKQEAEKQVYILQQVVKEKEIKIVNAEAIKEATILEAQGRGEAILIEATAKAEGITKVNMAFQSMPQQYVDVKYAEALREIASSGSSVFMDLGRFQGGNNLGILDYNKLMPVIKKTIEPEGS